MRKSYFAVILFICLLSACGARENEDAALTPTGYFSGEVGRDIRTAEDYASVLPEAVITEQDGTFGGSSVRWYIADAGDFVHFYYQFTKPDGSMDESQEQEHIGFAITGEDIRLACGIHTGMTAEDAEDIVPGLYHFRWDSLEWANALAWSESGFPNGWCRQFPEILIAEVENGEEMPLYVGFLLDENEIIRAISFCCPTAG